jgi:Ca2+-binding RTX toxin-like protein
MMAIINGTAASDFLEGTEDADTIDGKVGDDILIGDAGNDSIIGGDGLDLLEGADDNDILQGGADSDFFVDSFGNDTIDGGSTAGIGQFDYDGIGYFLAITGVNVNLATGVASDGLGGSDTLIDVEEVIGSAFNDILVGGNTANDDYEYFTGEGGNDTIDGGSGVDWASYWNDYGERRNQPASWNRRQIERRDSS